MFRRSEGRQSSAVEGLDSLLTAFLDEFSLPLLFVCHEGGVFMDDSSVFGGGSRPLGVIWVEADLGSCDVELGEVDRVLGGFYTVQGPGRAGSRPFLLALTLALRAGPPSAWPWPRVGLTPGQEGRARAGSGPTLAL